MTAIAIRPSVRISLCAPVITMVLAATAVPIEFRPLGGATLRFGLDVPDILANVAGYIPVGIVLGGSGALRAIVAAACVATAAEASQIVMMHREPSLIDVATNVLGAILGLLIGRRWKIRSLGITIGRWRSLAAATLASVLLLAAWVDSGAALNARGSSSPGGLEAHWKLDENGGRIFADSSRNGLSGTFNGEPARVAGVRAGAVMLDGVSDHIAIAHSSALRLAGSTTISAWINSSFFPVDDATILSNHYHNGGQYLGFQLETTVDRGPRTLRFKLADECGRLVARYGATPLVVNRWYHVAGVYDADAKTLDVYLNGELDDGFLLGSVSGSQRSSREATLIGRRSDSEEYAFAGAVDDVRIYSLALTDAEIAAEMKGTLVDIPAARPVIASSVAASRNAAQFPDRPALCAASDYEDARIPAAAAIVGILFALAWVGLWPSTGPIFCLAASLAAGWVFHLATAASLPAPDMWIIPLTSLAGGASVVASRRGQAQRPA
jgi:VanZ family protein